jgi:probable HAF family extracellular repeat protein
MPNPKTAVRYALLLRDRHNQPGFGYWAVAWVLVLATCAQVTWAQTAVPLPIRINAGGAAYTDSTGNSWTADVGFDGGEAACAPCDVAISGTPDADIYRSQRATAGQGAGFAYRFNVPNGTYQVRLHLAETSAGAAGKGFRVFDVRVEGRLIINDLDIFDSVGLNAALIRVMTVKVTDGQLDLEFVNQVERARVGGIEVLPVPAIGSRRYRIRDLGVPPGVPSVPPSNSSLYLEPVVPVDMNDTGWVAANGLGGPFRWNPRSRSWDVRNGSGTAAAINASGTVIWNAGWSAECQGNCGFVWRTNGEAALPGSAVALNDAETVAYAVYSDSPPFSALFVRRNGVSTPLFLGAPPSAANPFSTYAESMNARGWITGTAFNAFGASAFLWNGTTMRDLGTLGGNNGQGRVINDAGWVAGNARNASGQERAFLWDGVTMRDLGNLGGYAIYATDINESGWIAGRAATPPIGMGHAVVWDGEALIDLGVFAGAASAAYDIDEWGWVVGGTEGSVSSTRAFLWANGDMRDLNDLISTADPLAQEVSLTRAIRINARGWILASGRENRTGRSRAFIVYPEDLSPPLVVSVIDGLAGNQGWYRGNATLRWTVSDPDGDILESRECGDTVVLADTAGSTFTCRATSEGGTTSRSVTIKRDATAPVATAAPTTLPNSAGWFTEPVTVRFQGSDALSGVTACSPDVQVLLEGSNVSSPSGTCTDVAGNLSAEARAEGLKLDRTAPAVTSTRFPFANAAGWNNEPVTVTFSGTDATSGVASCTSAIVLSVDGAGQTASGTCVDRAGLVGSLLVTDIRIDRTPPTASAQASAAPNAAGWYRDPVTVTFSGADAMSGSGISSCTAPVVLAADGRNQGATGTCTDRAGNPSLAATLSVNVDRTVPTISITSPENGASFAQGAALAASFTCSDATSGVASCAGTVSAGAAIPTDTAGNRTFTVTATDAAGNTSTSTVTYTITPPPPKSGGGGALSAWYLLLLGAYALVRSRKAARTGAAPGRGVP